MAQCFCHLHLHTHYSMLDGFNRIPPLVAQTKKLGMTACAITDHGNLFGAIEFYNECKKGGIKPIIGYEAYLAPTVRTERNSKHELGYSTHLTLLAKNAVGFKNLIKLSSIAYLEGFYRNPRIDREILEAHKEGLVCLSGCLAGEFNQYIAKEKIPEAERTAKWFRKVFGENYYIEIQNNGISLQDQCTPVAADISEKLGVPLVATADAHYLCSEDALAHDVLFCISTRRKHDPRKKLYPEEKMPNPYYVRSPEDMYRLFPDYPDAVARSQEIADAVDIELDFKKRHFPVFTPPESKTPEQFLRELCDEGMQARYGDNPSEAAKKRLEHELGIITKMGFASYFLIVWDFVRFARESGIPCTARGSGCGAVVSYVLYLSHVCPLEYDLLFERFLDPNRSEAPDIDIDFCQDRRELVIDYVKRKYGVDSVAQIGTFGTLAAKAAMKDVGRALDVPLDRVNFMCKLVPMKGAIAADLTEAMATPDFKREYDADPQVRKMVDIALKLEGMNRNVGTHAAGVVIANGPITDYVPVQRVVRKADNEDGDDGRGDIAITTQWEMGIIEKVGMLKMDFLGLRNLTVLDNCVKLIKKTRGIDVDPMKFPLDDKATYELLQRGDAKGVFQLESEGIRELLKRMKPDNIRDLIAVLALYRPGPLEGGMVDEYVECKHGRRQPVYPHPVMEEVLSETYAVMVYQEQIMRILNRLGGIELAKAYACIKAISKKNHEIINARKADFVAGCQERGMTAEKADEIFELIVKFGGYGFNKCVVAETEVADAETGELVTVGELFDTHRGIAAHALSPDGKLRPRAVTDVVWNGRKRVYRLTTELGKEIVATANHPFRTLGSWTNLSQLKPGDRVAVPRRLPVGATESWPRHEVITLAGLLSEGNTCHPSTLYFYGNDRTLVDDFVSAVGQFPDTVAKIHTRSGTRRHEVQVNTGSDWRFKAGRSRATAAVESPTRSGAYVWAKRLGIVGKKATEKVVPRAVFKLCDADLELFLGRLWAGDGFIANDTLKVPFYATSSRRLASDVQHLLLRLGIVSRIHHKQFKYKGTLRPGYTVHILGEGAAETFLTRIAPHCVGRVHAVELLREHVATTRRGLTSKDTVPLEVREWVDEERRARGLTWDELERQSDVSVQEFYGTPSAGKRGFRRATIATLAAFFGSARLAAVADSDVFWDRVVSVEYVGVQDTYDLTVDEDHNFVANGLIVHNSHTAAYAQIGYQTAYLKTHYTAEYMAALLSSEIDDGNKRDMLVDHIADSRKLGIEVLPPDVNRGMADFDVQNNRIVFGLTAIKGLGRGAAEEIVRAREAGGKFKDFFDFCERIDRRVVQKAAVVRMVQAGAFDTFGRRAAHYAAVDKAYQTADERAADRRRGQKSFLDLFESGDDANGDGRGADHGLPDVAEWPETEKLKFEKEALDFYMSSHPLAQHDEQLRRFRTHECGELAKGKNGTEARVGGMIVELQVRTANKGRNMGRKYATFRVEDFTGTVRCIMWSDEYARFQELTTADAVHLFEGTLNWSEGRAEPDFQVKKVLTIEEARREFTKSMLIKLPYGDDEGCLRKIDALGVVLKRYKGACPVYLSVRDPNGRQVQLKLNEDFRVNPAALKVEDLEMILGPGAVLFSR